MCRICDRKFFLRASYQSYASQIAHYAQQKEHYSQIFQDRDTVNQKLITEKEHAETGIQREAINFIEQDSNKKLEIDMLQLDKEKLEYQST